MILTSYFANKSLPADYVKVRISLGNPRWKLPYTIAGSIKELAPSRDILGMNFTDYQRRYFDQLEKVGIDAIKKSLNQFGKKIILLCFENVFKDDNWCHRRIFADWYEVKTGVKIQEFIS